MKSKIIKGTWLIIIFLLIISSFSFICHAKELNISVSPPKNVRPGNFITQVLKISNKTAESKKVKVEINLPEKWKMIIPKKEYIVESEEEKALFFTILVPEGYQAGMCNIPVIIKENSNPKITVKKHFKVNILPTYGVRIKLDNNKNYIQAGKEYKSNLIVENLGNTKETFNIKTEERGELILKGLPSKVILKPSQVVKLDFKCFVPKKFQSVDNKVTISVGSDNLDRQAVLSYNIQPVHSYNDYTEDDYLWKIQADSSIQITGASSDDTNYSGYFKAGGNFYDKFWFDVNLSSSDLSSGLSHYSLHYGNPDWETYLGHISANVKALKDVSGEGIKIKHKFDNNYLKYFYTNTDYGDAQGIEGKYKFNERSNVTGGLMLFPDEDEQYKLLGINTEYFLTDHIEFNVNLAKSKDDNEDTGTSFKIMSELDKGKGHLRGKYYYTTREYPGEDSDREGIEVNGGYRFTKYNYSSAYGKIYKDNLYDSEDKDSLLYKRAGIYSAFYPYKLPSLFLGVKAGQTDNKDIGNTIEKTNGYSVGSGYNLGNMSISLGTNEDITRDLKEDKKTYENDYRGRINYRVNNWSIWGAYEESRKSNEYETKEIEKDSELGIKWRKSSRLKSWLKVYQEDSQNNDDNNSEGKKKVEGAAIGASYKPGDKNWSISLNLTKENTEIEGNTTSEITVSPRIGYQFNNGVEIGAELEKMWSDEESDYNYYIFLGKSFNIPIPGIREFASLDGIAYIDKNRNMTKDEGEKTLKEVLLKLDGIRTLTNKDGRYTLPPLDPGIYELDVSYTKTGLDCAMNLPKEVTFNRGEEKYINIPFIEVATISGMVFADQKISGEKGITSRGLGNIKIILESKENKYGIVTNSEGKFSIQVEPGNYKVRIAPSIVSERFALTTLPLFKLVVGKAENKKTNFGIYKKSKGINFTYNSDNNEKAPTIEKDIKPANPKAGDVVELSINTDKKLKSVYVKTNIFLDIALRNQENDRWVGKIYIPEDAEDNYVVDIKLTNISGKSWTKKLKIEL